MLRFITPVACLAASILPAAAAPSSACGDEPLGTVTVATVLDGRTFRATDGRTVRLAAIETPGPKAALETLVAGRSITLLRAGSGTDRYGRVVAFGFAQDALVQSELLRAGNAYVAASPGVKACTDELFLAERAARTANRGLWADPDLRPKSAANGKEIAALKGRFAVVEGRVLNVRRSGGAVYLNFGTYYTRDFSVMILKRNESRFAVPLKQLEGKRIRARGVVEGRRGPLIAAEQPEQIEVIE